MVYSNAETARVQRIYNAVADRYDQAIALSEKLLFGNGRQWAGAQARGHVLEVAIGTGRNLPCYAPDVRLTGVDLSPAMLNIARQRAQALNHDVTLCVGDAQALPFRNEEFDTVVFTLALCSIPDERRAVVEASRVLRPAGRLVLLEHVRSPGWPVQIVQRVLNPFAIRLMADHLLRDPLDYLSSAGFIVDQVTRSAWGIVERVAAHKPR